VIFVAKLAVTDGGLARPQSSAAPGERQQVEISRQLARLVDVIYGLVLVQGALNYRLLFTRPEEFTSAAQFLPVSLALALIYFMTIQSFVDYHLASERQPYWLLSRGRRHLDLTRFYLDILIVGSYSFMLLKSHPLLDSPDAELAPVFWTLPLVFGLYLVWGWLRAATGTSQSQTYSASLLFAFFLMYCALAFAYTKVAVDSTANSSFLVLAIFLMALYRYLNWQQVKAWG
jgi:hypothetical protein